jgi:hypothetical protein
LFGGKRRFNVLLKKAVERANVQSGGPRLKFSLSEQVGLILPEMVLVQLVRRLAEVGRELFDGLQFGRSSHTSLPITSGLQDSRRSGENRVTHVTSGRNHLVTSAWCLRNSLGISRVFSEIEFWTIRVLLHGTGWRTRAAVTISRALTHDWIAPAAAR